MIILGLTGSIGMGKSTAAAILRDIGVPVHCADEEVHRLLAAGGQGVAPVSALFPDSYDRATKSINRACLGSEIFGDPDKRRQLEDILHPLVHEGQDRFLRQQQKRRTKIAVLDIPLLFETGAETRVDYTLVVSAPPFIQRQRVLSRPGMDAQRMNAVIAAQMSDAEKRGRADFIVPTGNGLAFTRRTLAGILQQLLKPV
ncbi:MAG: dephospho-CoA kinase [Rhodospirillales bacterium]|nr:dephospho-CoA kinase [Rhodospirillales bacterium]